MVAQRISSLSSDLDEGRTSSRALTQGCLDRIAERAGEGARAFVHVNPDAALQAADAMDALRKVGAAPSPFAGIPISVKDLFDVSGQITCAGSVALREAAPAKSDAPAIARLRAAGFILVGRTNMTEFALSGLGVNPHYETPLSPWDRKSSRVPGGSSSGAAVSVSDEMAFAGIGTDTGGSCRVPAAFCGVTGFKPSACRIPLSGVVPVSSSLDSVGPLANSVECCAILDAILAGQDRPTFATQSVSGVRIAIPNSVVLDALDPHVARTFEFALSLLSNVGGQIKHVPFRAFDRVASLGISSIVPAESYAWHRPLLKDKRATYDPRVLEIIERGASVSSADYIDALNARRVFAAEATSLAKGFDVLAMPTCPIVPPRLADLAADGEYVRLNMLSLRNTRLANLMDGCAVSLPIHKAGEAPVGLMLVGPNNADRRVLEVGRCIQDVLSQ